MTDQASPAAAPSAALANTDPGKSPPPAPVLSTPPEAPAVKPGDVGTPEWLNPRLEQAKRSAKAEFLKDLGVDDPEVIKRALAAEKARADAEKTASELLAAEKKAREKAEKDAETYRTALSARAEAEFGKLKPEQQNFVEKQAGTDPAKRLATIEDVRALVGPPKPAEKTEAEKKPDEQPPPPPPPPAAKKVLPAPASTAPGGAPPGGQPPTPVDHLAVLERLDASNPIAAGRYYDKHRAEINRLRAQKNAASASQ